MEQQNLDSQIQKIFSQFNNKEYQIVDHFDDYNYLECGGRQF